MLLLKHIKFNANSLVFRKYLLTFFFIIFSTNCYGQNFIGDFSNPYIVNDVVASAKADSASEARKIAIANASRNALIILFSRINIDPNVIDILNDEKIADMVSKRQIIGEKITGNSYFAKLNLEFSDTFVKHHLDEIEDEIKTIKKNQKIIKKINGNFLLLPIKNSKYQQIIWQENNDWRAAIEENLHSEEISILNINKNGQKIIKLPSGNIDDITLLSGTNLNGNDYEIFQPILEKYRAQNLALAFFNYDEIENKVTIDLKNIDEFQISTIKLNFINTSHLKFEDLVQTVAEKTIKYLLTSNEEIHEEQAKNDVPPIMIYEIMIIISDLNDWLNIRQQIENSGLISQLGVVSISKDLVKIQITYPTSNGDIVQQFAKRNLYLQQNSENGFYLLKN